MKCKIVIVLVLCALIAGCSGVYMDPAYRAETELMNNRLAELNERCQAGDADACRKSSSIATVHVKRILDAVHGRESE